jgi:hypothetical protein
MASRELYGRAPQFGGALKVEDVNLSLAVGGQASEFGALVQSISATYARPVSKVYDVVGAQKRVFLIYGRATGQAQLSRLAAPRQVADTLLDRLADPCKVRDNTLRVEIRPDGEASFEGTPCDRFVPTAYSMTMATLVSFQFGFTAEAMVVSEQMALDFTGFERSQE